MMIIFDCLCLSEVTRVTSETRARISRAREPALIATDSSAS